MESEITLIFENINHETKMIKVPRNEVMRNILIRYCNETNNDIEKLMFLSNGKIITNININISEFEPKEDQIKILVLSSSEDEEETTSSAPILPILCPKCLSDSLINIVDYKIIFSSCQYQHYSTNILFSEFDKTQDISKLVCNECKKKSKLNSFNNEFSKCLTCNMYLCPLCKSLHEKKYGNVKKHEIIDYNIPYKCILHPKEKFNCFCLDCNKNLCPLCEFEHEGSHFLVKIKKIEEEKKINIDKIKGEINALYPMLTMFPEIKIFIDTLLKINEIVIKNYENENKYLNYYTLKNYINILNFDEYFMNQINITFNNPNNSDSINNKVQFILSLKEKLITKQYNENEIIIEYNINKDEKEIKIFDYKFVSNNIHKCYIKIENKKRELSEYINIYDLYLLNTNILTIFLCDINNITDISYMFYNCKNLLSIENINILDTSKVKDMSYLFAGCSNLKSLPNISNFITTKVKNMNNMFQNCTSLIELPDISNWNTINVTDMKFMFYNCTSLISLPDISKWSMQNVIDISYMFSNCKSLKNIPNLSKWNMKQLKNIEHVFSNCEKLENVDDISKWNLNKVEKMNNLFYDCINLDHLPNIGKWETNKVKDMSNVFGNCCNLKELPDISKWKTSNVNYISNLFNGCKNLRELPDISRWNMQNIIDMSYMFANCQQLIKLPNISKWNIKFANIDQMFYGCSPNLVIPHKFKNY